MAISIVWVCSAHLRVGMVSLADFDSGGEYLCVLHHARGLSGWHWLGRLGWRSIVGSHSFEKGPSRGPFCDLGRSDVVLFRSRCPKRQSRGNLVPAGRPKPCFRGSLVSSGRAKRCSRPNLALSSLLKRWSRANLAPLGRPKG